MPLPQDDHLNPYASPVIANDATPNPIGEHRKLVKDFRSQSLALGVLWILFGIIVGALAGFLAFGNLPQNPNAAQNANLTPVLAALCTFLSAGWIASGIGTLIKQLWGIYLGLGMSYLSLIGNLISFNICGLVLVIVILIQAHRVIKFAGQMRAAGIPLDTKP